MRDKMKLYTEEQVKDFLKERTFLREDTIDAMCDTLTPIELPSDEEIENRANEYHFKLNQRFFTEGAKWVIKQIKQQDNA